jgi:hypothetical protein
MGDCLGGNNCPATGLTLSQCQDLCFSNGGCGAIVHNRYNNGSCYVKGEKGGVTVDDEVHGTTSCAPSQGESGPGVGSWEVASPADYGLSQNAISAVDDRMASRYRNRVCHLVVKEGKIVYENYRQGWTESSIRNGASSTKTACAALYGIATEQGWASPNDRVRDRNSGTRDCNRNATFGNVLTMTGESNNIDNPTFNYDASGRACLDTIADFIGENNPEGLTQEAWKDKYWTEALGIEHSTWGEGDGTIRCGSSIRYSCRDLARRYNSSAVYCPSYLYPLYIPFDFSSVTFPRCVVHSGMSAHRIFICPQRAALHEQRDVGRGASDERTARLRFPRQDHRFF